MASLQAPDSAGKPLKLDDLDEEERTPVKPAAFPDLNALDEDDLQPGRVSFGALNIDGKLPSRRGSGGVGGVASAISPLSKRLGAVTETATAGGAAASSMAGGITMSRALMSELQMGDDSISERQQRQREGVAASTAAADVAAGPPLSSSSGTAAAKTALSSRFTKIGASQRVVKQSALAPAATSSTAASTLGAASSRNLSARAVSFPASLPSGAATAAAPTGGSAGAGTGLADAFLSLEEAIETGSFAPPGLLAIPAAEDLPALPAQLPGHLQQGERELDDLRLTIESEAVRSYADDFEAIAAAEEIVVGIVSEESLAKREAELLESRRLEEEKKARQHAERLAKIAELEALAKQRLVEQKTLQAADLAARAKDVAAAADVSSSSLHRRFRKVLADLQSNIELQSASVRQRYGQLITGIDARRKLSVEWHKQPQPLELRIHKMRAVKNKLPKGRYGEARGGRRSGEEVSQKGD